ncbi:MAG: hypothetical protein ABIH50_03335 [bacterium]
MISRTSRVQPRINRPKQLTIVLADKIHFDWLKENRIMVKIYWEGRDGKNYRGVGVINYVDFDNKELKIHFSGAKEVIYSNWIISWKIVKDKS